MNRRDFMRGATLAAANLAIGEQTADRRFQSGYVGKSRIYYEVHGDPAGKPFFLGYPIMASYAEIFGDRMAPIKTAYLNGLTDRYRVLLVDYPTIGRSGTTPATELTADRVCADLLAVADAAGFKRFAYGGFLWGAINGLLLASRSRRITALACGCWPPLGAPYREMYEGTRESAPDPPARAMPLLRDKQQYAQWVTYHQSLLGWPEARAVAAIRCPRLALYPAKTFLQVGSHALTLSDTLRARRPELEKAGWRVQELAGRDTAVMLDPAAILPPLRAFLDQAI